MKTNDWAVIGQERVINFFDRLLSYEKQKPGTLGGTYILSGPTGSGKQTALESFFKKLAIISQTATGSYEIATLEILEDKKEIGVSQAREFTQRLALSSFGNGYRLGVIHNAERLSLEAANALLKTLEEARQGVMVFLLTTSLEHLPATIVSRSQVMRFQPVASGVIYDWLVEEHGVSRPQARNLARLTYGQPGVALQLARDTKVAEVQLGAARLFCHAFTASLAARWQAVDKLLGNAKGSAAAEAASAAITSWRLILRDLRLLYLQQSDLVVHLALEEELQAVLRRVSWKELRRLEDRLIEGLRYLHANVSPKLVLEQIMMNL